jgi:krueppel-like factor 6/7
MDRYLKDEPKPKTFKTEPSDMVPWELFTAPGPISGSWSVKVDPLFDELLNDRNLDTLSMSSSSSSCSGKSWDSSLSCSVVVKKERIDDDYEDSDSNDEKLVRCINNNNTSSKNFNTKNIQIIKGSNKLTNSTIELLIARTPSSSPLATNSLSASALSSMLMPVGANHDILPTLTPPSSPESSSKCSNSKNLTISEPELALIDNQGIYRVSNNGTTLTRNTIVRLSNSKNSFGVTKILQMSPNFQAQLAAQKANSQGNSNQIGLYFIH